MPADLSMKNRKSFTLSRLSIVILGIVVLQVSTAPSHVEGGRLDESASSFTNAIQGNRFVRITDVSPDRPFGDDPGGEDGPDPGGQIDAITIDPNNPGTIYAAGETGGVWKSTDAAHTWQWSGKGLRNGVTVTVGPALAVDDTTSRRLLYATKYDDFRPNERYGGLYVSFDGAASWSHVELPSCPQRDIQAVAFSAGRGIVARRCGIWVSRDLINWTNSTPATATGFFVSALGPNVYACAGTQTWQSTEAFSTTLNWTTGPNLAGNCRALTPAPDERKAIVIYGPDNLTIGILDFVQSPALFVPLPGNLIFETEGSGVVSIVAARRPAIPAGRGPGRSYDLFIGKGDYFFQFRPGTPARPGAPPELLAAWIRIGTNVHIDTHGFAVPSTYDPDRGRCIAYAATDGGVFATEGCGTRPTELTDAHWVRAMHGLHAFGSYAVAGVSRRNCRNVSPCPALYLASNDNGLWGTLFGGSPNVAKAWRPMGCCGDSGDALIDPGWPYQVATFRPGAAGVFRSRTGLTPPVSSLRTGYPIDITVCGLRRGIIQIQTPMNQNPQLGGDYLAIRSCGPDTIVRNVDPSPGKPAEWVNIAPESTFPYRSVVAVQAANGHTNPTVYVLTSGSNVGASDKAVWKGVVDAASKKVPGRFKRMSGGLKNPINLFVNPYNANYLYVSDLEEQKIMSSTNGGETWEPEPELTRLATRNGEFLFDCGYLENYAEPYHQGSNAHRYACPLNSMFFVRDRPNIRVAVLHPGGVAFSRDEGANWIPLPVTELVDLPFGAFYDTEINPATTTPSLYVALRGRGLIRVDAPFDTIVGLNFELRGLSSVHADNVTVVDETTGVTTALSLGPDGVYRGTELFDSAAVTPTTHVYRYVVNNQLRSSQFRRTISSGEISSGVANVSDNVAGNASLTAPAAAVAGEQQSWLASYPQRFGGDASVDPELSIVDDRNQRLIARVRLSRRDSRICLEDSSLNRVCERVGRNAMLSNSSLTVDVDSTWRSVVNLDVTWVFTPADTLANRRFKVTPTAQSNPQLEWLTGERTVMINR